MCFLLEGLLTTKVFTSQVDYGTFIWLICCWFFVHFLQIQILTCGLRPCFLSPVVEWSGDLKILSVQPITWEQVGQRLKKKKLLHSKHFIIGSQQQNCDGAFFPPLGLSSKKCFMQQNHKNFNHKVLQQVINTQQYLEPKGLRHQQVFQFSLFI